MIIFLPVFQSSNKDLSATEKKMVRMYSLAAAELAHLAAQAVRLDSGTPYPVTAHELLNTKHLAPASRAPRTCSADRALEEVLERNALFVRGLVPESTAKAISRLKGGIARVVQLGS